MYTNINISKPHWCFFNPNIPLIHDTILTKTCVKYPAQRGIIIDSVQKDITYKSIKNKNLIVKNKVITQFFTINEFLSIKNMTQPKPEANIYFDFNNIIIQSDIIFHTTKSKFENKESIFMMHDGKMYTLLDSDFIKSCEIMLSEKKISNYDYDYISDYYEVFTNKLKVLHNYNN